MNTISAGLAYTLKTGANFGLNLYHGSGVASSAIVSANPNSTAYPVQRRSGSRARNSTCRFPPARGFSAAEQAGGVA